ncbi:energy-coupling factor transport system ATP-binding protein [Hazenella coriacea]|uniref:Energy-coupling factor transport system ATP-binding protein n=2 Tax=Hazenella coriacea TaxID=1179467 RepID=A0A4R3L2M0_9BACL|nr:energy-coupling factor transport system ATP-binding protein [Hazenella coriacea]
MAFIEVKQFSFTYAGSNHPTLSNLNLTIKEGSMCVLVGPSGSGKTTLLRHLKKELSPVGTSEGEILYLGKPIDSSSSTDVGMVFQDPDNQIVMDRVQSELVFGLENHGLPTTVMRKRVAELAQLFQLDVLLSKPIHELSGGQKQLVNLASILLLRPKLLLLDEPTAQLDPIARQELIQILIRLNQEWGITIILAEHQLEDVYPWAEHVVILDQGQIVSQGKPQELIPQTHKNPKHLLFLPQVSQLALALDQGTSGKYPLTVKEGREWVQSRQFDPISQSQRQVELGAELLRVEQLHYRFEKNDPDVIKRLDFTLHRGDFVALFGANGSGKSTLLRLLCGQLVPQRGVYRINGKRHGRKANLVKLLHLAYLGQNPKAMFIHETLEEEFAELRKVEGISQTTMEHWIERFQLTKLLSRHPFDLSYGERQKAGLALLLPTQPDLLLLDEPTKGLDPISKQNLAQWFQEIQEMGITILMATHDLEFAAQIANRCALLFDGRVTAEGTVTEFFQGNSYYTTVIDRVLRGTAVEGCLTVKEVKETCLVLPSTC